MRDLIEKHLAAAGEATAKNISLAIHMPQLDVSRELNKMHGNGIVEREKRAGGGNEYVYWLSQGERPVRAAAASQAGVVSHPASDVDGEAAQSSTEAAAAAVQRIIDAARDLLGRSDPLQILQGLKALDDALMAYKTPGSDFAIAPDAHAVTATAMVLELLKGTQIQRDEFAAENASLKEVNARLKANNAELEKRIDSLSGDVRPLGQVFVTVGRNSKPMRHTTIEKAQRRGRVLVSGERETEVLVLEPIGRIVRGAEWHPRRQ
ncbi:1-pyrroline-5-carboxylate dehydrogenase [Burkholderia sp. BCCIQ04A]|uniref:1-pyrroline-5-carboxylate dehydrogenase n=1 Tax=Burkholderia anthinoferrum TaxID=3090833 RepID=A0ABU5WNT3_9BURK|nr:1-pyrroline-5-carboxylate dehydrogenase [Burkholderia anthinoferrum]MEB2504604.1 1-pyrroline-5-carboxylate dehydrogenase [Burkholderia anthinoferrum]MEB2530273.1 1-pyrroline-5-carboxylate dehydrogenase [Burkholderia anthinoferrum]MEB2561646.1 1-pyrroline-5-carboxylate dehydrogenase [Burkholderia anthinoferrum]MEB2580604.1 1-pyrroline-5-carboxylate dehydrogenase [Burkholderia anthinoferrum]MEB2634418.1 1-pyrroline-5-carboxylate dehydrogenase [Burkholderia anthinoferrum]